MTPKNARPWPQPVLISKDAHLLRYAQNLLLSSPADRQGANLTKAIRHGYSQPFVATLLSPHRWIALWLNLLLWQHDRSLLQDGFALPQTSHQPQIPSLQPPRQPQ